MSRPDIQDYDYPPGIMPRNNIDRDVGHRRLPSATLNGLPTHDRALPAGPNYQVYGVPAFPSTHSASSRSLGMHDKEFGYGPGDGWVMASNNANRRTSPAATSQLQSFNHLHPSPLPPSHPPAAHPPPASNGHANGLPLDNSSSNRRGLYLQPTYKERGPLTSPSQPSFNYAPLAAPSASSSSRSTLWWGELEPWMDEEYAKQVCNLMGWDPVSVKVPHPAPDPVTGQQANNPGYCFLTFPTPSHAASVLTQINTAGSGTPITMPNSTKPFLLNWASSTPIPPSLSPPGAASQQQQFPKEYSIFVGDLAPEASNSDLVAVFRNPVLGLRNDREPKFIRPFLSCKSAKIMLDPVTGVSRGYGFVRFTDESDQQRALIEMHGLYCLSRPMRISPATAKYKPPPSLDLPQVQMPPPVGTPAAMEDKFPTTTVALPLPPRTKSVSSPIAGSQVLGAGSSNSISSSGVSSSSSASSLSAPSLSSGPSTSGSGSTLATAGSEDMSHLSQSAMTQLAQFANGNAKPSSSSTPVSITGPFANPQDQTTRHNALEESWKHQAQARAILSNLIGPNGEQLTSTDPYNTTVFVGGLSPLISEETLRTFFAPFGEIHYVKVPVGKHCGFVQFVRKADAERAIEKMQGFPIGGSRIRLSWGRSQYKAAQAAAQAAQAAALQASVPGPSTGPHLQQPLSAEQAIQLLQKFGYVAPGTGQSGPSMEALGQLAIDEDGLRSLLAAAQGESGAPVPSFEAFTQGSFATGGAGSGSSADLRTPRSHLSSTFSPFSPDPNMFEENRARDPALQPKLEMVHAVKNYAPGFGSIVGHEGGSGKTSPPAPPQHSARPPSVSQRYSYHLEHQGVPFSKPPLTTPISRPPSSSKRTSPRREYFHEQDPIQDLNGTLASLDLDHAHPASAWHNSRDVSRQ
ncbi:hypothetical protein FA95DRAFT_850605 [Auriscalpium vulgare]|uniref:Uncharacterized protein n=1 Tax=Auriscalpium vulgare TaxID=40419 RepID=A0ACB8RAP4_9AGAM|nr:hypothetical protein FA95DRAFT_850605 [Auriscalpium vulgare]